MHIINSKLHTCSKWFTLLLIIILVTISSLPAYAAEGGTCGSDLNWELEAGVLTITGSGDMTDYTDNNLAPWYDNAEDIKSVVLTSGITSVGNYAFYGCSNMTSITIPKSLKDIGSYAFLGCKRLLTVNLGSELQNIGDSAFQECESLKGISFPSSLTTIGTKAFYRCSSISIINIPSSVTGIGNSAFAYCYSLVRATVNAPLTALPSWMFYGCDSLTDVSLAPSIVNTGEYSFQKCGSLSTVYTQSENIDVAYQLEQSIIANNDTDLSGRVGINNIPDSSVNTKSEGDVLTQTTVTDTGNAVISFENTSDSSGEETVNDFTINATVDNSDGWKDLAATAETATSVAGDKVDSVNVNVQLSGSSVEDSDLSKLAGKDVLLNITTSNGTVWKIDMSQVSDKDFSGSYDLDVSLESVDSEKVDIASDIIYSTKFPSTTSFNSSVGIKVDNAYQLATLYQKSGGSYEALQTVVVDENGNAWFNLASIDEGTDYYIGINSEGVTTEDAVIPESLYSQYGIDEVSYLTDDEGTRYELTGRYSKWGITGKQFAIYVGIAVGLIVVIVTVVMITFNKMNKSKAKYMRRAKESKDEPIDEDALRMEIMKEMLEESKAKGKDAGKKIK